MNRHTFTSSLVVSMKFFLPVNSLLSILNFDGFFSRISMVSSRSSRSHSILRNEFFNSVLVHSISSLLNLTGSSCSSNHRRYSPLVLFRALKTSLQQEQPLAPFPLSKVSLKTQHASLKTKNTNKLTKEKRQNVLLFYYEKGILQRHVNSRRLAICWRPAKLALNRLKTSECSVFIFISVGFNNNERTDNYVIMYRR